MSRYDVAIAGGGMIGATLAALLDDAGLRVALIDAGTLESRWAPARIDARVSAITSASKALFASLGLWSSIEARRVSPYVAMEVWDQEGSGEIRFDASDVGAATLGHIVENGAILDSLLAHLRESSRVTLLSERRVVELSPPKTSAPGVSERTLTMDDGETLDASLVIGADGSHSPLRALVRIAASERPTGQRAIVASVRHLEPHRRTARQCFLPSGPLAFLPLAFGADDQHWSSIVWSADEARAQELLALDDESFAVALGGAFQQRLGAIESVTQRIDFPLVQRHAERYVAPSFALVGDAAHSLHPLAGQGANLGLMDVAVLAEELARAARRGAPLGDPRVLARYARRRRLDNAAMLRLMDAFRIGFGSRQPLIRLVRNLGLTRVDRCRPLKRLLIRQALGERFDLPNRIDRHLDIA
ncbi:UbiH/UbiF/VisC/COQ6 family ubiquinone biosynthesis hydroxylase [Halotalea alkalilenta]|uniref:UbiH/UbiF/VisC/COQ6 family ubiquinone biosynthesis hydroxylase n=1 Tax=Halotalea alkalilenta TaxID=376489 RepID=UPI00048778D2|nr:UbiH/UbiF/VisC/COQ6 family ubiquinone biosynthesis hydroxylase [Halotalea alkalilenta]